MPYESSSSSEIFESSTEVSEKFLKTPLVSLLPRAADNHNDSLMIIEHEV